MHCYTVFDTRNPTRYDAIFFVFDTTKQHTMQGLGIKSTPDIEANKSSESYKLYASSVLYRVNIGASLVHAGMLIAIVTTALMTDNIKLDMTVPVVQPSIAYATCKNTGNTVDGLSKFITTSILDTFCQGTDSEYNLIPFLDYDKIGSLYPVIALCAISVISVLFHLGNIFIWREKYEDHLGILGDRRHYTNMFRWIESSLTFSIIVLLLGYYCGVGNIHTLILMVLVMFTIMWVAFSAELSTDVNTNQGGWLSTVFERLRINALAYILLIFLYGILFSAYHAASENGTSQGAPGYTLGMLLSTFTLFLGIMAVQTTQMQIWAPPKFWYGELAEIGLTSILKLSFQITMLAVTLTWHV